MGRRVHAPRAESHRNLLLKTGVYPLISTTAARRNGSQMIGVIASRSCQWKALDTLVLSGRGVIQLAAHEPNKNLHFNIQPLAVFQNSIFKIQYSMQVPGTCNNL